MPAQLTLDLDRTLGQDRDSVLSVLVQCLTASSEVNLA